jgi:flagellar assembly protein FliH
MGMTTATSSFKFGRDFGRTGGSPFVEAGARLPLPYAEHARLLDEAREEARLAGIEEGRRLQKDDEATALADALQGILARLEIATVEMRRLEDDARREALEFARIFSRKIAGRMIENAPVAAIEATARAIFNDLRGSPHVAVRVAPGNVDECKARLTLLLRENGLDAKLFVFPDPEILTGDCRIEWADGGIVRDREKLQSLIDGSVALLFPETAE